MCTPDPEMLTKKIQFSQLFKAKRRASLFTFLFIFFRGKKLTPGVYAVYDGVSVVLAVFTF